MVERFCSVCSAPDVTVRVVNSVSVSMLVTGVNEVSVSVERVNVNKEVTAGAVTLFTRDQYLKIELGISRLYNLRLGICSSRCGDSHRLLCGLRRRWTCRCTSKKREF